MLRKAYSKTFRVKPTHLEEFSDYLHSVLPKEAKVSSFITSVADVTVVVPSKPRRVFREIMKFSLLL